MSQIPVRNFPSGSHLLLRKIVAAELWSVRPKKFWFFLGCIRSCPAVTVCVKYWWQLSAVAGGHTEIVGVLVTQLTLLEFNKVRHIKMWSDYNFLLMPADIMSGDSHQLTSCQVILPLTQMSVNEGQGWRSLCHDGLEQQAGSCRRIVGLEIIVRVSSQVTMVTRGRTFIIEQKRDSQIRFHLNQPFIGSSRTSRRQVQLSWRRLPGAQESPASAKIAQKLN